MEPGVAIVRDARSVELREPGSAASAIYDRPIRLGLLHRDPSTGAEHYVVSYPAGLRCRLHRHSAAHTMVVLEGTLDANGTVIGPGGYAHFPAGEAMRHQAGGDAPCLFVLMFDGAFDVEQLPELGGRV